MIKRYLKGIGQYSQTAAALSLSPRARAADGSIFDPHEEGMETDQVQWWELHLHCEFGQKHIALKIWSSTSLYDTRCLIDFVERSTGIHLPN